jgi:formiminotetrahydrofolate cyclodeaminase
MIEKNFQQIVESFAAKTPTPGGGAAAALAASIGAGLFLMVVRFSRGKKQNLEKEAELAEAEDRLSTLLVRMLPMAERDCASFDLVSAAYQLPKDTDENRALRARAIEEAMVGAMVVPEETLCSVRDVFEAVTKLHGCVGKNIVSDFGSGSALLEAAAEGAYLNVRINAGFLSDKDRAQKALIRSAALRQEVAHDATAIRALVERALAEKAGG